MFIRTKKPKPGSKKIDLQQTPLHHADDWTRRRFIQGIGMFMAAFGAPWAIRMDTMSKISRKILGGSEAFAQSGGGVPLYSVFGLARDGFGTDNVICLPADYSMLSPGRALFAAPNDVLDPESVQAFPTAGGRNIYCPGVMSDFVSSYADWIVHVTNATNTIGHQAEAETTWVSGSSSTPVAAAYNFSQLNAAIAPNVIVFGNENNVNVSRSGPVDPIHAPVYMGSVTELQNYFDLFRMTSADGLLSDSTTAAVLDSIKRNDVKVLEKLQVDSRPGGLLLHTSLEQVHQLLLKNYKDKLVVSTADRNAILDDGTGNPITPTNQMSLVGNIGDVFATIIKMFEFNICPAVGIQMSTQDWHSRGRGQGANTGDARSIDLTLNRVLLNFFNILKTKVHPLVPGQALADHVVMSITSEFARGVRGISPTDVMISDNWNDNNRDSMLIIGSPTRLKAGCFGDRNNNNDQVGFNYDTAAPDPAATRPGPDELAYTALKAHGVTDTTVAKACGFSSPDKVIRGAFQ